MKILFISLGCDKNLVDTEVMLGLLASKGYEMTDDEQEADIIVINTCCFIHDAKEESIQNILEMAELKKEGKVLQGPEAPGHELRRHHDHLCVPTGCGCGQRP